MFDHFRWNADKSDMSPGTLEYAGVERDAPPAVDIYAYDETGLRIVRGAPDRPAVPAGGGVTFVLVRGVHDPETVRALGEGFGFPMLALEDVLNTGHRPKLEWIDDETCFIVMRGLRIRDGRLAGEQVSLFWRNDLVVAFLESGCEALDGVTARIERGKGRLRSEGGAYLMVAILDALVDRQIQALAEFGDRAEELEDEMDRKPTDALLADHYELKRDVIMMHNLLMPVREIFKELSSDEAGLPDHVLPYLRDTAGHHEQAVEGAAVLHDILKSMIDYQISLMGMRTNRTMQFLTAIATVFIPLTFIAGVYGMNFDYMPELRWRYGYFLALGIMVSVAGGILAYFVRKRLL